MIFSQFLPVLGLAALTSALTLPLKKVDVGPQMLEAIEVPDGSNDLVFNSKLVAGLGTYYFQVDVGTPPHPFRLIADTGSSFMAISSDGCQSYDKEQCNTWDDPQGPCPAYDPLYDESQSTSATSIPCHKAPAGFNCSSCDNGLCGISLLYGDGSCAYGWTVSDIVSVAGDSNLTTLAYFGNLKQEAGDFASNQTDGIIGLAYSVLSNGFPTFIDQLVASKGMTDMFAMCLGGPSPAITLGGLDATQYEGKIQYTPIIDKSYYVVGMSSISFGGNTHSSEAPSIVDSGTTGLILAADVYLPILSDWKSECESSNSEFCQIQGMSLNGNAACFTDRLSLTHLSGFPKFQMTFPDVSGSGEFTVTVPGEAYTMEFNYSSQWCYTIVLGCSNCGGSGATSTTAAPALNILGDAFMKAFYVVFDRANSQIGFAESACLKANSKGYFYYYLFGGIGAFLLLVIVGTIVMCCCHKKKNSGHAYGRINDSA